MKQESRDDGMEQWERNFQREGMRDRDSSLEWWSRSSLIVGLHVFNNNDGNGWHWKINSLSSWESKKPFATKEEAFTACEKMAEKLLLSAIQKLKPIVTI